MDVRAALKGQYDGALAALRLAIEACPEELWSAGDHPRAFWRIAYHALFFTHFYLQPNEAAFRAWDRQRDEVQFQDALPWPPHDMPKLDHQIMNIRHTQEHVGQLSEPLHIAGVDTEWVGGGR